MVEQLEAQSKSMIFIITIERHVCLYLYQEDIALLSGSEIIMSLEWNFCVHARSIWWSGNKTASHDKPTTVPQN